MLLHTQILITTGKIQLIIIHQSSNTMQNEIKAENMDDKKSITDIIKKFDDSLAKVENNQVDITNFLKKHQLEEKDFEDKVTTSINALATKIQSISINSTNNSNDNTTSSTVINPASSHNSSPSHRFGEAMKTVSNPNFLYNGNPKQWPLHKKKLINLIWALNLNRLEAIKTIKLSLNGQALFISDNIDMSSFEDSCNGNNDTYQEYLQCLETLFVGKAASDLSRSTFSTASQDRNEPIPLYASRLISLFTSAYPEDKSTNNNILIIDRFLNGLNNNQQKKFILQNKEQNDTMDIIINLALKFEAVNQIMDNNKSSSFNSSAGFNNVNSIQMKKQKNFLRL